MVNGYYPETLAEALRFLDTKALIPYAGGTDLMVEAKKNADYLFIGHLPELRAIRRIGDTLGFGAACTFDETLNSDLTPPILKEACAHIAAPAIRNLGTLGGNIANASPKADSALIFIALGARLKLQSAKGERIIPIEDFYLGRNKTILAQNELLTEILLPAAQDYQFYYHKVGARAALSIARLSFAGIYKIEDGKIARLDTAFGAITDVVVRRPALDETLCGLTLREASKKKAAYLASYDASVEPIRGRVSQAYRKDVMMNLLKDFLREMGV